MANALGELARRHDERPQDTAGVLAAVRVLLAEELGVDPGPDLQRVHADLLAGRTPQVSEAVRAAAARRPGRSRG